MSITHTAEKNWFVNMNGNNVGPMTQMELVSKVKGGQLNASNLIWSEGMAQWTPLLESEIGPLVKPLITPTDTNVLPFRVPQPQQVTPTPTLSQTPVSDLMSSIERAPLSEKVMLAAHALSILFMLSGSITCLGGSYKSDQGMGYFFLGVTILSMRKMGKTLVKLKRQ